MRNIWKIIRAFVHKILSSRLAILGFVFCCMWLVLVRRLYDLQIVHGEEYQSEFMQMTEKEVITTGYRGNIYDKNGNLLAGNELAYVVTVQDNGEYEDIMDRNAMFLRLIRLLNLHGHQIKGEFKVSFDGEGKLVYTTSSEIARKRFLCDVYGLKEIQELTGPDGDYPENLSAEELLEDRVHYYKLNQLQAEDGSQEVMTTAELLQLVNIRYTMGLTAYRKYEAIQITSYIDEITMAAILENTSDLAGVNVERTTIRRYYDSVYFAPVIGYVGKVSEQQLEQLNAENPELAYGLNDIVGRTGIEASMEPILQGRKGYQKIHVDNVGHIVEVMSSTEAQTGSDVYLTLDKELQKGIYDLIERRLADVVISKLENLPESVNENKSGTSRIIPIRTAYAQLISNQVLSTSHMQGEGALETEKAIWSIFMKEKTEALASIEQELQKEIPLSMEDLPENLTDYIYYLVDYLANKEQGVIQTQEIDKTNQAYCEWKSGTGNLKDYLYAGLKGGWIDIENLEMSQRYLDLDEVYTSLVKKILELLMEDDGFDNEIYSSLIRRGKITGCQMCLALYEQGLVSCGEDELLQMKQGNENSAYQFLKKKIKNLELTPAQMALEPCTASVVVTEVNTGKVLALVSYPGYDNNRLAGIMDVSYYHQLLNNMSNPLFNNATQTLKAPGSVFKPITAIAALEEGVVTPYESVDCTGLYNQITNPIQCWIYPGQHGKMTMEKGIQNSCNYYFAEMGHRLSVNENGIYDLETGVERIRKYAALFGLDQKSGVELPEAAPHLTTQDPERSAIGQATHAYANVQLARYVTALANRGTVYQFSLIDRIKHWPEEITEYKPDIIRQLEFEDTTWEIVQSGMRGVVTDNPTRSVREMFRELDVAIAGKTGTAQESKNHANHAFFISYGPYEEPEISVSVSIPNGYASSNAAALTKDVYQLYYSYLE
ncbi:MAG: penicillin-binding protein [Clostridiales bacterium]|nr:penicillin-binding protein [Clostridiales bacterium]